MTREIPLKKKARELITQTCATVLFSNPVGMGWMGKPGRRIGDTLELHHAHPVSFGLYPDSPDEFGWKSVVITPDMVGTRVAILTAIEWKRPGEITGKTIEQIERKYPGQLKFVRRLQKDGAIADVLDNLEDGILLCKATKIGGLYKR